MATNLRVGIIGVNAERGWAREGHVPAVQALDGLELIAVATRHRDTAEAAAVAFDVERGYGDPKRLIDDPDIDIVDVATSVPAHRELITAALDARKHVITEWPVGPTTADAEAVAAAAAEHGDQHVAVGLQARTNPAALRARELIASGTLGRILTATVYSSTAGFGGTVPQSNLYLEKPETGMNLPTIQTAHTLDFVLRLTGPLSSLSALTTIQYPEITVPETSATQKRTIADHVLVHGRLDGGGAVAVQVVGGRPPDDTPFRADIVGADATLTLIGGNPRGFQAGTLTLHLDGEVVDVDAGERASLPDSVLNVAGVYAALRDDIRSGTTTAPGPDDATRLAHLIDDVLDSAADGRRVTPTAAWPTR